MNSTPKPASWGQRFSELLSNPAAAGLLLMVAAAAALVIANTGLAPAYFAALDAKFAGLSVLHWINDALMAAFFLLVGLEIKREMLIGQLASWPQRVLPGMAALGGMAAPALVYLAVNSGVHGASHGWAIPAATDIAFALGVLSLLGPRVPVSLKVFLTALAIIDDLGAVLIIAMFYTAGVNGLAIAAVGGLTVGLFVLNRMGYKSITGYLALGCILWFCMFKSGIHATLAGVLLAFAIPLRAAGTSAPLEEAPLLKLEHALQPWVAFLVVPIFGFANAGVAFLGIPLARLADPVPLGVALGLFLGKQIGILGMAVLAIKLGLAKMPSGATWRQIYGVALLCGIGFTMSLFIGLLAFAGEPMLQDETKLGVLLGSVLSAVCGALLLRSKTASAKH